MATRMFFDNFESYAIGTLPTTNWSQDGTRNLPQVYSSAGPNGGSNILLCNWNGTLLDTDPARFETAVKSFGSMYTDEFLLRVWVLYVSTMECVQDGSNAKIMRFLDGNGATYFDWFHECKTTSRDTLFTDLITSGTRLIFNEFNGVTPNLISGWHKIEYYCKKSTGAIKQWIDGTLVVDITTGDFSGGEFNTFYIASNYSAAHDASNHIAFDDVEFFSDDASGTATIGSMSDASIEAVAANPTARGSSLGGLG